jgi:hypothetical protein
VLVGLERELTVSEATYKSFERVVHYLIAILIDKCLYMSVTPHMQSRKIITVNCIFLIVNYFKQKLL